MPENDARFTASDFDVLGRIDAEPSAADSRQADDLWSKTTTMLDRLGADLFGAGECVAALWPDSPLDDGERGPFLWARLKRAGAEQFAMHLGIFVSPGFCNLALDLEKDLLDAGRSGERLEQVVGFYRDEIAPLVDASMPDELEIWTDTRNVVAAAAFPEVDFDAFMAANRDAGHPWPKIGYILDADAMLRFGDRWVEEMAARATPLLPIYDAMIRSFRAE